MPFPQRVRRGLLGAGIGAVAVLLTLAVNQQVRAPFLLLFPALFLATWLGHREGGVTVLAMSAPAVTWILDLPRGGNGEVVLTVALYVLSGALVIISVARMREAVEARDALMAILGHDLKSPLGAMLLKEQLLLRQVREGGGEVSREKLEAHALANLRQIERTIFMINNLLDVSRVRARKLTLSRETLDLAELVSAVVDRFRPELDQHRYDVRVEHDGQPNTGEWDRLGVEQIAANLVSNAIKYGDGKPIDISTGGDETCAWLTVKDLGRGMSEEDQKNLYRAFEKSGAKGHSHGLGMWFVRKLVDAHGGEIELSSAPAQGTSVRIALPRRPGARRRA
jgi:signal transduction histidine kinase